MTIVSATLALTPLPLSPGHILWRSGNGTVMRQIRIVTTRFATPVSADAGRRTVLAGPNPPPPTRSWRQKTRNHVQSALREKNVRDRGPGGEGSPRRPCSIYPDFVSASASGSGQPQ